MTDRWPQLMGPPAASGRIRVKPEDFRVEEIPAYALSGQGEHLFCEVEKTGLNTDRLIGTLADHLGIPANDIGCAGLKDRQAITRQWLSLPARAEERLASFEAQGVRILRTERHGNKLKTGHLKGNRFIIRIREIAAGHRADIDRRIGEIGRLGVPNYYGEQRFGRDGNNEEDGRALLLGIARRMNKRALRFALSAIQSALFNDVLAERIRAGLFSTALLGDLMQKAVSGGLFPCAEPEVDQPRLDAFEIHATGPMFGSKMREPTGQPADMEQAVLDAAGLFGADWKRFGKLALGTRRPFRMTPEDLTAEWDEGDLVLRFSLPPGAYATTVLAELVTTSPV